MFNRAFNAIAAYMHGNNTGAEPAEPYECLVAAMMSSFCQQAAAEKISLEEAR